MTIHRAIPAEADLLTRIAHAAKAHWGYPDHWLLQWSEALTITPGYVAKHPTFVATDDRSTPVGFCALKLSRGQAVLDHLWVTPASIRSGIGRTLFRHAEDYARNAGATRLKIVGDPHAAGFYVRMGAIKCGEAPAPMDGCPRVLPRFEKSLLPATPPIGGGTPRD